MKINDKIELLNMDCMDLMKRYEDNHFDLAIVDPVYGHDGIQGGYTSGKGGGITKQRQYEKALWDQKKSSPEYLSEVQRVSKNQIIWGGNYFANKLPVSMGWIFWDKDNGDVSFSDGEFAWTSFQSAARSVKIRWSGMLQYDMKNKEERIHPTQKPIPLYKWLLAKYAKKGDKILDTHLGSANIAIALNQMNTVERMDLSLVGAELVKKYYDLSIDRVKRETRQLTIFQ